MQINNYENERFDGLRFTTEEQESTDASQENVATKSKRHSTCKCFLDLDEENVSALVAEQSQ